MSCGKSDASISDSYMFIDDIFVFWINSQTFRVYIDLKLFIFTIFRSLIQSDIFFDDIFTMIIRAFEICHSYQKKKKIFEW